MSDRVEARSRRAPFFWASTAAFRGIVEGVEARDRALVGWVYSCLCATASELFDGGHEGFGSTAEEVREVTGVSRPTFRKAVQLLEGLGLLLRQTVEAENGRCAGVRYVLLEPGQGRGQESCPVGGNGVARTRGQASCPDGARASRDGGKKEETSALTSRGTRGEKPVTYKGRKVAKTTVATAEMLLGVFNEATGRTLGLRNAQEQPSPYLRQIIGALLERPDVEPGAWARAIRNTAANPPGWADGRALQTGDVFGMRAADHALANTGVPRVLPRRGAGASIADLQALKGQVAA